MHASVCISMHQHASACASMHQHASVCIIIESAYNLYIESPLSLLHAMWCPDGIGRESWVWVVAPSQGESMTPPFPRSGVVSARRQDRIAVSKRNVPRMKLLLNVIYSKQIIIDKDVDFTRIHSVYQNAVRINIFSKKSIWPP